MSPLWAKEEHDMSMHVPSIFLGKLTSVLLLSISDLHNTTTIQPKDSL